MSHFSKIKTNITDFNALTKTISQLGFSYKLIDDISQNSCFKNGRNIVNISVYQLNKNDDSPVFDFVWSGQEYILVTDVQLWNLDIDFNYLLDRIFQQYAYNIVVSTSSVSGFNQVQEELSYDGSIKLTLQKWN